MDRQWQRQARGQYATLISEEEFHASLPPLPSRSCGLATTSDVYACFSVLHAQRRHPRVQAAPSGGFYYLTANLPPPDAQTARSARMAQELLAQSDAREAIIPLGPAAGSDGGDGGGGLSVGRMHELFAALGDAAGGGPGSRHASLALVDSSGGATMMRLFDYVQPPFEGPEMLPVQGEGGEGGGGDDDAESE